MKYYIPILLVAYLWTMSACNTTRIVKPLAKKELAVGVDLGGPIIDFSTAKIPVPFSSLTFGYGIDSNVTVFGAAHITSAIFGTIQWDMGVVGEVLHPQKGYIPGLSIGASSQMMVDVFKGNFRMYPVLDVNLYWEYLPKHQHYFYFNWGSWFDLWERAHGQVNTNLYYPSFSLGHTFENKKMRYTIEGKYIAPTISNMGTPLHFNGIDGRGSWGVYVSIYRKF
ncbi:hypothetical protein [Aureispira anguillae]|uniref:Uncharacterized protein n=1 Tax=Aureispira anguillae TaxID=2864201 RepID=A0A915YE49_9BACT|nr:hypothetical protein [Aureispira anguillae]BDS11341.1 hypothetical protein AsAng_0020530 [Aureispira anguillae]